MSESGESLEVFDLSMCVIACGTVPGGDIQGDLPSDIFLASLFRCISRFAIYVKTETKNRNERKKQ